MKNQQSPSFLFLSLSAGLEFSDVFLVERMGNSLLRIPATQCQWPHLILVLSCLRHLCCLFLLKVIFQTLNLLFICVFDLSADQKDSFLLNTVCTSLLCCLCSILYLFLLSGFSLSTLQWHPFSCSKIENAYTWCNFLPRMEYHAYDYWMIIHFFFFTKGDQHFIILSFTASSVRF